MKKTERIVFDEVSVKAIRRWTEDGKRRRQQRTFKQTLNPWNRNNDTGFAKTRIEILIELGKEARDWILEKQVLRP